MTDDEKRGKLILELRKKKGLTQKEVGELIHYTDKNISKWENGKSFPNNPNVINRLAEIFEVSVEELMYGELKTKENEEEIKKHFVKQFRDNYNKYKKNINIITFVFLICIIFALLGIYVTFIKNSVSVYSVEVEGENIRKTSSTLLITNKINILNFNKLKLAVDKKINNLCLYYINDNGERIEIFSGENTDYFIKENVGYEEYFLNKLKKNKTYLEINYSDGTMDKLEVYINQKYVNDNIFPKNSKDLLNPDSNNKNSEIITKLESLGFQDKIFYYEKTINNNVIITIDTSTMNIKIIISNKNNFIEQLSINNDNGSIVYSRVENGKTVVTNKIDTNNMKNCEKEICRSEEDYAMYLNYLIKELL